MKVVVFGRGKLGSSLAPALRARAVSVRALAGRALPPASVLAGAVVVLCVPDAAVADTAARLAPRLARGQVVLHCAGALGPDALAICRTSGAAVASFHPLVSFAAQGSHGSLAGASFVAQGDPRALRAARALASALGAHCVVRRQSHGAYHASAALVANGAAALAFAGVEIFEAIGFRRRDAERAFSALLASVAANIAAHGLPAALTGPVARGDIATVESHLRALDALGTPHAATYRALLPALLACADAQGLPKATQRRMRSLLAAGPPIRLPSRAEPRVSTSGTATRLRADRPARQRQK